MEQTEETLTCGQCRKSGTFTAPFAGETDTICGAREFASGSVWKWIEKGSSAFPAKS